MVLAFVVGFSGLICIRKRDYIFVGGLGGGGGDVYVVVWSPWCISILFFLLWCIFFLDPLLWGCDFVWVCLL